MRALYREIEPPPALKEHILNFWEFDASSWTGETYSHTGLPDGCVSLVYACPAANHPAQLIVVGPRVSTLDISIYPGGRWWGLRFWPDSCGSILNVNPVSLLNLSGPTQYLLPHFNRLTAKDLSICGSLEDVVSQVCSLWQPILSELKDLDPIVRKSILAITASFGTIPINSIAADLAISERQFTRRFQASVGITPKQFSRIRRFRTSAGNLLKPEPDQWAQVAYDSGYADQAHLSREFLELGGSTPTKLETELAQIQHKNVKP